MGQSIKVTSTPAEVKVVNPNSNPLIEAVKELARIVVLAVVPVLIASIEADRLDWKAIGIVALLALLRGIDRYIHESPKIKANGITPF